MVRVQKPGSFGIDNQILDSLPIETRFLLEILIICN